jgi:hypothetical protein
MIVKVQSVSEIYPVTRFKFRHYLLYLITGLEKESCLIVTLKDFSVIHDHGRAIAEEFRHWLLTTDVRVQSRVLHVGSEVFTAVIMKISVVWDVTPCCPLKLNQRLSRLTFSGLHGTVSQKIELLGYYV